MVTAGAGRGAALAVLLGAAALLAVAVDSDAAGRLLALPAAVVLAAVGIRDLALRPVLRADTAGLEVVVGLRRRQLSWPEVHGLRVVDDRRTPLLEVDLGSTLVVLTRRRLGRPPDVVLDELLALQRCGP